MSSIYYQPYSNFLEINKYIESDEKYIEIIDRHKEMLLLEVFIRFCLDDIKKLYKFILLHHIEIINKLNQYGMTVLHYAVMNNKHKLCEFLLLQGADKTICSKDGKTAYEIAVENNFKKCIILLENVDINAISENAIKKAKYCINVLKKNRILRANLSQIKKAAKSQRKIKISYRYDSGLNIALKNTEELDFKFSREKPCKTCILETRLTINEYNKQNATEYWGDITKCSNCLDLEKKRDKKKYDNYTFENLKRQF